MTCEVVNFEPQQITRLHASSPALTSHSSMNYMSTNIGTSLERNRASAEGSEEY